MNRVRCLVLNAALGPLDYRVPDGMDPIDTAVPVRQHLDVITSNSTLAAAEIWLAHQPPDQRARVMTRRLNQMKVSRRYDYVAVAISGAAFCSPSRV